MATTPFSYPLKDKNKMSHLVGSSGVYMLINTTLSSMFYIGSSVNLGRRMTEYSDLINNIRTPGTKFEKTIRASSINDWQVVIMCFVPRHLVLVEEQLAICNYNPTYNVNHSVVFNYWLKGFNTSEAIRLAKEYQSLFAINSVNYNRFTHLIESFSNVRSAKDLDIDSDLESSIIGKPVFVYDYATGHLIALYSSINKALQVLECSQDSINNCSDKQQTYTLKNGNVVCLSLVALTVREVKAYIEYKPESQLQFSITLTDANGNIVEEHASLNKFCAAHGLSVRTFRRKLAVSNSYNNMTVNLVPKSRRIAVYCYDPDTKLRVRVYPNLTRANKAMGLHFNNAKVIISNNNIHNGLIYSYSDTYPL